MSVLGTRYFFFIIKTAFLISLKKDSKLRRILRLKFSKNVRLEKKKNRNCHQILLAHVQDHYSSVHGRLSAKNFLSIFQKYLLLILFFYFFSYGTKFPAWCLSTSALHLLPSLAALLLTKTTKFSGSKNFKISCESNFHNFLLLFQTEKKCRQ